MAQRYDPQIAEPRLAAFWQEAGVYHYVRDSESPVYSVDTPPPTVSGFLHLGHVYSYSHADFLARFRRMSGDNVFYPMGFDDNGLPTDRLVEQRLGVRAVDIGRKAFTDKCLEVSEQLEAGYRAIFQRLGLSCDWRHTYRTVDHLSRRTSQLSFVDLWNKDLVYRRRAPTIWCPECRTAIAQAEENDLERPSELVTIRFQLEGGAPLPIATTRPELLPACVAAFVHPDDTRFHELAGKTATVPLFGQEVPVLADSHADPEKGTGIVMCCTFGDTADVEWWYTHQLPLRECITRDGRLTALAGEFAGLPVPEARRKVVQALEEQGLVLDRAPLLQSVRVHERCDTPVEYIVTQQWFVRVLDHKGAFLEAGERVTWRPAHMKARYREWVENLHWDWCISRQRYYGVPFPVWYCDGCGEVIVAPPEQLPVDPTEEEPRQPCSCGSTSLTPEQDVMDTWATSSMTPQIVGRWLTDPELYRKVFPMSLRPQAHEIIRTWAFDTIVKSHYMFEAVPWKEVLISGWGVSPQGSAKISKSRGGGPMPPMDAMEIYSADALRYWAASTGLGKDAVISDEKFGAGKKLVTKLWNVAGFSLRFLEGYRPPAEPSSLSTADRWILSRTQRLIRQATEAFAAADYAVAKNDTEVFFWRDLADNYLEMAKKRLYNGGSQGHEAARYTLYQVLLTTVKLFAPILPFVTEEIYQTLFRGAAGHASIHTSPWPVADEELMSEVADRAGEALVGIATAVRRYKSDRSLSLSKELERLQIAVEEPALAGALREAADDISSVTRAGLIEVVSRLDAGLEPLPIDGHVALAVRRDV